MKNQPKYLVPGDTVVLIAPSRSVALEDVTAFSDWVSAQGWKLELGPHLFEVEDQFAGNDLQRASDLIWAISHPKAKAIFTARGGYGCVRTVAKAQEICKPSDLIQLLEQSSSKWLVGFSDVTWLHLLFSMANIQSIHGPVATQWKLGHPFVQQNIMQLGNLLAGKPLSMNLTQSELVNPKPFAGELIGGNLSLLYASLGTPYQPVTKGKVLFIEDLDEYYYHVDRMLYSLKLAGLFDGINGLLVGSMIDMNDNAIPFGRSIKTMIKELLVDSQCPIVFDIPVGHDEENMSIKLGANCNFEHSTLSQ
mgnify:FL=1